VSRRPGFVVDHMESADGGVSPNRFHPVISVQMRCNWPPLATEEEIRLAMAECYVKAQKELEAVRQEWVRRGWMRE
jgi:hypothetical protein